MAYAAANRAEVRDQGFFRHQYPGGVPEYVDRKWEEYAGDAHEAIQAMREPTEEMTFAGSDAGGEPDFACATMWRAMIDAALPHEGR